MSTISLGSMVGNTTNNTYNTTLTWPAVSGAQSYELRFRPLGTTTWSNTITTIPSKIISGCQHSTTYEFQAKVRCSSSTSGLSWSTPDLSYSNIESAKTYKELMRQNLEAISLFFKQKLGAVQVGKNSYRIEWYNNPVEAANFYFNLAKETLK